MSLSELNNRSSGNTRERTCAKEFGKFIAIWQFSMITSGRLFKQSGLGRHSLFYFFFVIFLRTSMFLKIHLLHHHHNNTNTHTLSHLQKHCLGLVIPNNSLDFFPIYLSIFFFTHQFLQTATNIQLFYNKITCEFECF